MSGQASAYTFRLAGSRPPSQTFEKVRSRSIGAVLVVTCAGVAACARDSGGASAPGSSASTTGTATSASGGSKGLMVGTADAAGPENADGDGSAAALRIDVAPGGNFDLSLWELQLPIGSPGNPTTIGPTALEGPTGFTDSYFFTDPTDGAMTFWDPESGVTTADSSYPRSELREMNADGSAANWPIAGTNTLSATLAVSQVPDHVCIGQIHVGSAIEAGLATSTKPLLELYYDSGGNVTVGIEDGPSGGQTTYALASVPLGTPFSYVIQITGDGTIGVTIDASSSSFSVPAGFDGYGQYFKAGDYDQTAGADAAVGAIVKFYALRVTHAPS